MIHHLSFGPDFPGQVRPLDGHASQMVTGPSMFQYHVKIVPTLFEALGSSLVDSNQFSATDFVQDLGVRAGAGATTAAAAGEGLVVDETA